MKLSHSSVSMFTECPGKWKFKYVDKLKEKPKHFFSFGKSVHSALEFMYGGEKCPTLTAVLDHYYDNWISEAYKSDKDEAKAKRDGKDMLCAYYARHAKTWRKPLAVEIEFDITINNVRVKGFIDRVDIRPDGTLHVIDYKTGRMWEELKGKVDEQLTLYQIAVEELGMGKVGAVGLLHVPTLKMDGSKRHGDTLVQKLKTKFVETAARITRGEFPYTPSDKACSYCDFKKLCPAWK